MSAARAIVVVPGDFALDRVLVSLCAVVIEGVNTDGWPSYTFI